MARIRTIKPDFWTDEKLTECSLSARLLFIGSWNFADDKGNLGRSAKKLKMQVFPADNIDCEPLIVELITHGLLIEYSVNGEKYLHIKGFAKHQVINRPSASQIPPYVTTDESVSTHGELQEGREGKGKEEEGKKLVGGATAPSPRGTRLPADWALSPEWEDEARKIRAEAKLPPLDLQLEGAKFRDFWHAKAGKDAAKLDWLGTWRNWVRNAKSNGALPSGDAGLFRRAS